MGKFKIEFINNNIRDEDKEDLYYILKEYEDNDTKQMNMHLYTYLYAQKVYINTFEKTADLIRSKICVSFSFGEYMKNEIILIKSGCVDDIYNFSVCNNMKEEMDISKKEIEDIINVCLSIMQRIIF